MEEREMALAGGDQLAYFICSQINDIVENMEVEDLKSTDEAYNRIYAILKERFF